MRKRKRPQAARLTCAFVAAFLAMGLGSAMAAEEPAPRDDAVLYRRVAVPEPFLITRSGRTFGGDLRIGDLDGDGRCDLLVYRCNHGAPKGAHQGGMNPCFLGAFDLDGRPLWHAGQGGNQPSRPMSVAVHDMTGDGAADVVCFWHAPDDGTPADWRSLADVVVQIRDGRTGKVIRQTAPPAVTERRMKDPGGSNWVHQRILIANFRGTAEPRDLIIKLGDTYVALDEHLRVMWTYRTEWVKYTQCPAYIPSVGDLDGDGRDEVNGGYFVLDDGTPLWENKLGPNMDSVTVAPWDAGRPRAICSGAGHVVDSHGSVILALGAKEVPHGQEVRVADFRDDLPGPEMVIRHLGHTPDALLVSSADGRIVDRFKLNPSPTNVGMESIAWRGAKGRSLLYSGGWLWDLQSRHGAPLPGLPPPGGGTVHRMGFYHAIAADLCSDRREELVLWDPTAREVFIYTAKPLDQSAHENYRPGPRQVNPRLMD